MTAAATAFGCLGILLGLYILVTRIDPMRIGVYALPYVLHWIGLGSGCMVGGVFAVADAALPYSYLALVVATASYVIYQRRAGTPWRPPDHAQTHPSALDEVQHDRR